MHSDWTRDIRICHLNIRISLVLLASYPRYLQVLSPLSGWSEHGRSQFQRKIEAAGVGYQAFLQKFSNFSTDSVEEDSVPTTPKSPAPKRGQEEDDSSHEVAVNENVFSDDCYEILGLQHLRMRATANDIKKAYRILILKHHPDKMISSGFSEEDANAGFKKLNQAYEKMSNEDERRVYDSEDSKFDNSIPLDRPASDEDFYSTFRPVFDRNACWSSKLPVPRLGDAATPIAAVLSFYDFWTSFSSWREFNADPELDINQASCREEKRWLQRQIDKEKKEKKTEENARVRTLVENARKWDPRVIRHKAEVAAAAAAAKAEKERLLAEEKLALAQAAKAAAEQKVRGCLSFLTSVFVC